MNQPILKEAGLNENLSSLEGTNPNGKVGQHFIFSIWGKYKAHFPILVTIIILIVAGQILSPGFGSLNNINNLFAAACILGLATLGQTLIIIAGKEGIDLSVGALMSMGAVVGANISNKSSFGLTGAIIFLILLGTLIGLINGFAIQKLNVPPLVMTMVMATIASGFTFAYARGAFSGSATPILQHVGSGRLGPFRWLIIIGVIVLICMELILRKSRYGSNLFLIGSNRNASILAGLHTDKIVIVTYIVAGIAGTLSGVILLAFSGIAQFGMGSNYTLLSVAAVVIGGTSLVGGKGTYVGSFLGSIMLVVLTTVLVAVKITPGVLLLIQGLVLLIFAIIYSRSLKLT